MLYEKDVFYDSDCLVCFLAVRQCGILQQLFSKVIVPLVVKRRFWTEVLSNILKIVSMI